MHATDMRSINRAARVAGWIYLSMMFTAPLTLIYIPNKLVVRGDATATASHILNHEMLFRVGIVAELVGAITFILLGLALYRLFSGVSKAHASVMVAFMLVSAAVGFANVVNNAAALTAFRGTDSLAAFTQPQRDALGMLFLGLYRQGLAMQEMFWGLWIFPFGVLVIKSRFLPRLLGVWLLVNGAAYVALSLIALLWPSYSGLAFRAAQPALLGELWIMLWLVIKGAKITEAMPQPLAAARA